MTDETTRLRDELRIAKRVANELGGIVQGVVDALGIRRDAERDVVLAELGRRLVPAGGSAPADEVEQLTWERDMALSRVAAAEAVAVRMGDSLPASGPVDSWSERDRAVRDYEGELAAALATEDDTVGERLREVERERDEARQERDDKVVELTITRAVLAQQTRKRDEARAAVRGLVDNYTAHDQQAFEAAHEAAIAVLAGGSAPHQGATTDATAPGQHPEGEAACTICKGHGIVTDPGYYVPGEQFVEPPSEDQCDACVGSGARDVQRLVSQRTAVLARLAAIESKDTFRRILSGYLPSTIFTSEVRALLGAGETTEETHD